MSDHKSTDISQSSDGIALRLTSLFYIDNQHFMSKLTSSQEHYLRLLQIPSGTGGFLARDTCRAAHPRRRLCTLLQSPAVFLLHFDRTSSRLLLILKIKNFLVKLQFYYHHGLKMVLGYLMDPIAGQQPHFQSTNSEDLQFVS